MSGASDPRLMIYGPYPDGQPRPATLTLDSRRRRHAVQGLGTLVLGYVHELWYGIDGNLFPDYTAGAVARTAYQAEGPAGQLLDGPVDTLLDAAALVVGAAHSQDPDLEHVVPRCVGGRPKIGQPINVRLGNDLLAEVDGHAAERGMSRADALRHVVRAGLDALRS